MSPNEQKSEEMPMNEALEWPMIDGFYRVGGELPHVTEECFLLFKSGKISGQIGYSKFDGSYQKDGQNVRGFYTVSNLSNYAQEHPRGSKPITIQFAGSYDNSGNDVEGRGWFDGSPGAKFSWRMHFVCAEHEDPVVMHQLDDGSIGPKSMEMLKRFADRPMS
jgi:hypothetical protein